jgi:hypothetical protein
MALSPRNGNRRRIGGDIQQIINGCDTYREYIVSPGLSQRALDYLIATRRLPTRRIGGRVLIPVSELRKYARTDHPERIVA